MNCFNEDQLKRISHIVQEIEKLTDVEKLLLYLQLPCGRLEANELTEGKSKALQLNGSNGANSNGPTGDLFVKKPDQETTQTYTWILSHLEVDPNVSLPKQEVYDEYRAFCHSNRFEPLCVADFGKAMKHAFPCIKPRRLGQRGNSRYCYSGLRKRYKIEAPNLPDLSEGIARPTSGYQREPTVVTYCQANNCYAQMASGFADCRIVGIPPSGQTNRVINLKIEPTAGSLFHMTASQPMGCHELNCGQHQAKQNYAPDHRAKGSVPMVVATSTATAPTQTEQLTFAQLSNDQFVANEPQQEQALVNHDHQAQGNQDKATVLSSAGQTEPTAYGGQPMNRYDDYMGVIQQPGSPDDDDYQHNYQHASPLDRHLFSGVSSGAQQSHCIHSATNYLHPMSNVVDAKPILTLDPNHRLVDEVGTSQQAGSASDQSQQSQPRQQPSMQPNPNPNPNTNTNQKQEASQKMQPSSSTIHQTDMIMDSASQQQQQQQQVHHLSYIADPMMDHCASPFQSPASTPYPAMVTNYLGPNLPEYYSSNDCVHYST